MYIIHEFTAEHSARSERSGQQTVSRLPLILPYSAQPENPTKLEGWKLPDKLIGVTK